MSRALTINESSHATPGYVVATSRGASPTIVWRGAFADLRHQRGYDAVHCHPQDGQRLRAICYANGIPTSEAM